MSNLDIYHEEYRGHTFHNNVGWVSSGDSLWTSISTMKRYPGELTEAGWIHKSISFVAEYPGPCYKRGNFKNAPSKKRQDWQSIKWPTYEQAIEIEKELVKRLKVLIDEYENEPC